MSDPFEVIGTIPEGMTYQWSAVAVAGDSDLGRFSPKAGWTPVPADRHPEMPSDYGNCIVIGDQMLMERPTAECEAARHREVATAREWDKGRSTKTFTTGFSGTAPDPSRVFEQQDIFVQFHLRLSPRRVEAADICGMSVTEYAQALLAQIVMGYHGPVVLAPTADQKAFELREEPR